MKRIVLAALLVLAATLAFNSVALAQESDGPTHVYGVVFFDANANGVWDVGERGAPDVTVVLETEGAATRFEVMSAPLQDELDAEQANTCSPLTSQTPCEGTWGIIPAGPVETRWQVTVLPPAGHTVTSVNPQMVQAQKEGSEFIVQFGLVPVGAGGGALLPATGSVVYEMVAAGLFLLAGSGLAGVSLILKSRRPR